VDFLPTEEDQLLRNAVRDFATRELEPRAREYDEREEFPWENFRKMAEMGLTGIGIPQSYGGAGGGYTQLAIAAEEIARADASTSTILIVTASLCNQPILKFGTEEQKRRFTVPLAKGDKVGAFGLTEPNAGSDAGGLQTTAVKDKGAYVLNGSKIFISNGDVADYSVVFASQDKSSRSRGISAFIVEKGMPGFSTRKQQGKLGIRSASTAELFFEDCRVPAENRLGDEGYGFKIAMQTIDGSRIAIAAQAVGVAQACYEVSIKHAKGRQQFGKPIADLQAIQWMLADMATGVDAARLLTLRAANLKDRGLPYSQASAMAKLFAAETAMKCATNGLQIHGGYGYFKESPIERYFRDAKITQIYEGTSEIQRLVIARHALGLAKN